MADPLDKVIDTLFQRRLELEVELARIDAALKALLPSGPMTMDETATAVPPIRTARLSVRQMVVALLDEANRDWSVSEVLAEYERRGTPIHGASPEKSLRAALAEAKKAGQIVSTAWGRYKSAGYAAPFLPADRMTAMYEHARGPTVEEVRAIPEK